MRKIYYQCRFRQTAPLRLTNGENEHTDSDLMLDGQGKPFIPGSALAGVLQSMLVDKESAEALFGFLREGKENGEEERQESRVQVSDATLHVDLEDEAPADGNKMRIRFSVRHGVRIEEATGTAADGAKYDFETVEVTGGHYTAVLELNSSGENDPVETTLEELMRAVASSPISFGARTTRGYGDMKAEVYKRVFDLLKDSADRLSWLDFDPFSETCFGGEEVKAVAVAGWLDMERDIRVGLAMEGSFIVRVRSTDPEGVDHYPLTSIAEKPVIPGTSWAGVFRHHMLSLARQAGLDDGVCAAVNELFGKTETGNPKRSRIRFHETEIDGGNPLEVTRVALDRFTMAPRDKAMLNERVWQGGQGELRIQLQRDARLRDDSLTQEVKEKLKEQDKLLMSLLDAALLDMHYGLLNVGGEGNVGRGRASITSLVINGKEKSKLLNVEFLKPEGGDGA